MFDIIYHFIPQLVVSYNIFNQLVIYFAYFFYVRSLSSWYHTSSFSKGRLNTILRLVFCILYSYNLSVRFVVNYCNFFSLSVSTSELSEMLSNSTGSVSLYLIFNFWHQLHNYFATFVYLNLPYSIGLGRVSYRNNWWLTHRLLL